MEKHWKQVDDMTKKALLEDKEIHAFLRPVFSDKDERRRFIQKCLRRITPRRMLNHAHWYLEMADNQEKVRPGRPALKIIFLMALAEYITKMRIGNNRISSTAAIHSFFTFTSKEDKLELQKGIQRALIRHPNHQLRFSSLIRILYDVRNQAVHGEDYYSFSLADPEEKRKHAHYTHWGLITSGYLVSRPSRRNARRRRARVALDITLTYEELREIFRRTAIANITSLL